MSASTTRVAASPSPASRARSSASMTSEELVAFAKERIGSVKAPEQVIQRPRASRHVTRAPVRSTDRA